MCRRNFEVVFRPLLTVLKTCHPLRHQTVFAGFSGGFHVGWLVPIGGEKSGIFIYRILPKSIHLSLTFSPNCLAEFSATFEQRKDCGLCFVVEFLACPMQIAYILKTSNLFHELQPDEFDHKYPPHYFSELIGQLVQPSNVYDALYFT